MLITLSLILGLIALHFFFVWTGCTPVRAILLTVVSVILGGLIAGAVVEIQNISVDIKAGAEEYRHSSAQEKNRSFETKIREGSLLDWVQVDKKLQLLNDAPYLRAEVFYKALNCMLTEHYVKYNSKAFALKVCSKVYPYVVDFWTVPRIGTFTKRVVGKKWAHVHELLILEWKSFFEFVGEIHKEAFEKRVKSKLACELCKDRAGSDYSSSFLRRNYWREGVEIWKAQNACFEQAMKMKKNKLKELVSLWAI